MAVDSVFISSVMTGFEEVRARAAAGVEKIGMHPIMAERLPAVPEAPRRALLDEVSKSDIYLLLLGPRYGEPGDSGKSPTEEEYDEAVRRHRPVLVLIQAGDMEPEQQAFLERIRGSWEEGTTYDKFTDESEVAVTVAGALARMQAGTAENAGEAQARAEALARGPDQSGTMSSGVPARVAFVPLRRVVLLDALALEDQSLSDNLSVLARETGLIPHKIGIDAQVSGDGVRLVGTDSDEWTAPEIIIEAAGAIAVTGSVRGGGTFSGSLVDPDRLEALITAAGQFAQGAWQLVDRQGQVGQVAVTAAIPDAQYKGFGTISGGSMSSGHGVPPIVVAPLPAEIVPRGQVASSDLVKKVLAAIRRVFLDAGAVHDE